MEGRGWKKNPIIYKPITPILEKSTLKEINQDHNLENF